jgi:hypothetical protein
MKKLLAIMAIAFLASCGSGEKTETADSSTVKSDSTPKVETPDSSKAAGNDSTNQVQDTTKKN